MVLHDLGQALEVSDRIVVMKNGRKYCRGNSARSYYPKDDEGCVRCGLSDRPHSGQRKAIDRLSGNYIRKAEENDDTGTTDDVRSEKAGEYHLLQRYSAVDLCDVSNTLCPLMGAAMAVRGIQKAVLLVIGTDECAYYTKHMTLHSEEFGGVQGRCVSAVLDTRDVTFGCKEKLDAAVAELMEEYQPPAVFLVTTCVVEIIGDDMDAMAQMYTKQYGIPFLSVHTEHFKCENHLPGIERTMSACFEMMRPQEKNNTVIFWDSGWDAETTELYRILTESGIKIGMQLPCGCSVEEIIQAPSAGVNLVLDETAPLARKMKEAFGTPYIRFERFIDPQRIWEAYQMLFDALQRELPPQLEENYKKAQKCVEQVKENYLESAIFTETLRFTVWN